MSWQIALMGASVAMSAAQAASSASRGAAAVNAGAEQEKTGAYIRAAQGRAMAAGTQLEIGESRLQTQQQEIGRRREIAKIWQANAIDLVARGGRSDGTDSMAALQAENARLGEEDVANIRLMGESRVNKLSFRKKQFELGASAADLSAIFTGENAARKTNDLYTDMGFKLMGTALSAAGSMAGGLGGGGGSTPGNAAANAPSSVGGTDISGYRGAGSYSYGAD